MLLLLGCASPWPAEGTYFPWMYTPEPNLEPWEEVRWETETWSLQEDPDLAALYLYKSVAHRKSAPVEEIAHFDVQRGRVPRLAEGLRLSFVGDIMWIGANWSAFALPAAGLLDGDLRVGNLETPTSPDDPTDPAKLGLYTFNAPPEILDGLPVDLLQLTNNHALDVGDDGLEATVAEVEARGLVQAGIDQQAEVTVQGTTIALLAWTWGVNDPDAVTAHDLHVVPFGHLGEHPGDSVDLAPIEAALAASTADRRVVLVHWGFEYEYYPDPHFMVLARRIIAAGADLVVGEGPHVVQPVEICEVNPPEGEPGIGSCRLQTEDGVPRTAAVAYSLGDFGTDLETWPLRTGIVLTVSLGEGGVTGLGWEAEVTVPGADGPEVQPLAQVDDAEAVAEAARLAAHLGASWRR